MSTPRAMHDGERFEELLSRADMVWNRFISERARFQHLIPADPRAAAEALGELSVQGGSFLELGAGTGLITIIASLLGFDAYGIEIEAELVEEAWALAEEAGSSATFVEGSFVPLAFRDEIDLQSGDFLTITEGADAYEEMGLEMADFDVVYAYPWPGEEDWTHELVARHARAGSRLMTYSVREGFVIEQL